ncbi:MAG: hypothetical protein AB1704_42030 [Pseudomonadota bacterium]|uniref:hypothetical protein n=1 Tax=Burkholderiaceae TaxID=119060 RepID=UPI0010F780F1|nr:hypothetical protein [Burkholderia sp. 4M9327F10]
MTIASSTLFTFCIAWVAVYVFLKFVCAVWTVTEHFNRMFGPEYTPRHASSTLGVALEGAAKLMGWGAVIVLPAGAILLFAALFR